MTWFPETMAHAFEHCVRPYKNKEVQQLQSPHHHLKKQDLVTQEGNQGDFKMIWMLRHSVYSLLAYSITSYSNIQGAYAMYKEKNQHTALLLCPLYKGKGNERESKRVGV